MRRKVEYRGAPLTDFLDRSVGLEKALFVGQPSFAGKAEPGRSCVSPARILLTENVYACLCHCLSSRHCGGRRAMPRLRQMGSGPPEFGLTCLNQTMWLTL